MQKNKLLLLLITLLSLLFTEKSIAQKNTNFPFEKIAASEVPVKDLERRIIPQQYDVYKINLDDLRYILSAAPKIAFPQTNPSEVVLALPVPGGGKQEFAIYYDPIMEQALADKYPEIKTYFGVSLRTPGTSVRFDLTPVGFHAMVTSNDKDPIFIDPYYFLDDQYYTVYWKSDYQKPQGKEYRCGFDDLEENIALLTQKTKSIKAERAGDCGVLRTYRLALSCTVEYSTYCGGTVALTLAAMNTTMNRVNSVYQRDYAVRMNIIADNWKLIYATTASGPTGTTTYTTSTDPFTNSNGSTMLTQNQTTITNTIGAANYDIGHVFSTGGGGVALLSSVCGTSKAQGVTGSSAPSGDPFDIDYVAHEMGHQFGGPHTFAAGSTSTGSCSASNVSSANAFEVGSGTTIQAYAGICSPVNVQSNSDAYFHAGSLEDMMAFITGTGNSCAVVTATGNNKPTANAGLDYSIPISTPFTLTGTASDPDGDAITGCWEQMDAAVISTAPTGTATTGPLFRSLSPVSSMSRTIPKIADIASNATTTWEKLSSVARTINMRFTVRDNKAGNGCTAEDNMVITTVATPGAFAVTYPTNTGVSWSGLNSYNVTWAVNNTNIAPINCATVSILLSTDGGLTYPTVLAAGVPNNGTANVTCPNTPTTTARIRVQADDNIFFDISNNNFIIVLGGPNYTIESSNATQSGCSSSAFVYDIATTPQLGYTDAIAFTASNLPSGAIGTFSSNSVTPGSNLTFTLSNLGSVASGTYSITINTTSTAGPKSLTLTLNLTTPNPAAPTLVAPSNGATLVATTPTFTWSANSNALSYDLQVSADNTFSNPIISVSNLTNTSYAASTLLAVNTVYYWRMKSNNNCGTSTFGSANSFTTDPSACVSLASTNVPVTISASGTPIVYSTIDVGASGTLSDVNILDIVGTHSYISDLRVSVKSPASSTYVTLWSALCSSNINFNISFDDESSNLYSAITCPMTGGITYRPSAPLSAFDGQALSGIWTLRIEDLSNLDGGSLTGWKTQVCAANLSLPVQFLSFNAIPQDNAIVLKWVTTAENNNKGFEIQRSEDINYGFRKIAFVNPLITKDNDKRYEFVDNEVENNKMYYYRLRQIDNDGSEIFTKIEAASLKRATTWDIAISPNPTSDFFRLNIYSKSKEMKQVTIYSMDGKMIKSFETIENELNIDVAALEQGLYLIKVSADGTQFTKKFMKK